MLPAFGISVQLLTEKHPKDSELERSNHKKRPWEKSDMYVFNSDDRFFTTNKKLEFCKKLVSLCLSPSGDKKERLEMF